MTETARIHQVMSEVSGHRGGACKRLGITREQLVDAIKASPDLKALWGTATDEINVEQAYTRELPVPLAAPMDVDFDEKPADDISPRELALVNAYADQSAKVQQFDWEGIGITDKPTLDLMQRFEQGVGHGVLKMMDAMQGGMAYCFARVSKQFHDVDRRLSELRQRVMDGGKQDLPLESFLHDMFMQLGREMQKFNKEATNAAHVRLLIAARARKLNKAGERLRQGGWQHAKKVNGADVANRPAA